jgi:hypothetical protein
MKYEVRGADRNTGADEVKYVEADDAAEAEEVARGEGMLVSRVRAVGGAAAVSVATPPQPALSPKPMGKNQIRCAQCGSPMDKKTRSKGNALGLAVALIVFVIGVGLSLTIIGAVIGVPLCILSLFIGGRRYKVWKCTGCPFEMAAP